MGQYDLSEKMKKKIHLYSNVVPKHTHKTALFRATTSSKRETVLVEKLWCCFSLSETSITIGQGDKLIDNLKCSFLVFLSELQ